MKRNFSSCLITYSRIGPVNDIHRYGQTRRFGRAAYNTTRRGCCCLPKQIRTCTGYINSTRHINRRRIPARSIAPYLPLTSCIQCCKRIKGPSFSFCQKSNGETLCMHFRRYTFVCCYSFCFGWGPVFFSIFSRLFLWQRYYCNRASKLDFEKP